MLDVLLASLLSPVVLAFALGGRRLGLLVAASAACVAVAGGVALYVLIAYPALASG